MFANVESQSLTSSDRYIQIWSKSDAVVAELHDTINPQLAWVSAHDQPSEPTWPKNHPPLILLSDQPLSDQLITKLAEGPCPIWTFSAPTSAWWAHNWDAQEWAAAIDLLRFKMEQRIAGLSLAPGCGLTNVKDEWFISFVLESLIFQHPDKLPLNVRQRRSCRTAMRRYTNDELKLQLSRGARGGLVLPSEAERNE